MRTRCPACRETVEVEADVGKLASCPSCQQQMTVKPAEIWDVLDKRERAFSEGNEAGLARIEQRVHDGRPNSVAQQRRLFHGGRHDVQYEAGVDRGGPIGVSIPELVVVLDDLRSQWNVGAIFRTAECAGWGGVQLCGISPMPPARGVQRVALGAEEHVSWHYRAHVLETIDRMVGAGFLPVALEQTDDAIDLYDFALPQRALALVVGNEVGGVSREALQACPVRVSIPLAGRKASLNAAVAFGIAAFTLRRRWLETFSLPPEQQ